MKKNLLTLTILLNAFFGQAQTKAIYKIITKDIDYFWEAFDSLAQAKTTLDSVSVIDRLYFGRATDGLTAFRVVRPITALKHVETIRQYPKFWRSLRPVMYRHLKDAAAQTAIVFKKYQTSIPNFRKTGVAFVVGCMNTGGTTNADWIFIGTEIAASDTTVDRSELQGWYKEVIGNGSGDMTPMIAHEAIHTQQISTLDTVGLKTSLEGSVIDEGVADFIPYLLLKNTINAHVYKYGYAHECELWQGIQADFVKQDYTPWLYGGNDTKGKPADLGYFIGFRIAEAFYNKHKNKREALDILLKSKDYKAIIQQSGYNGTCMIQKAMTFQEAEKQGKSYPYLDSLYKSAVHSDTSQAVFKTPEEQQILQKAYGDFLKALGTFLKTNNFKWEKLTKCFNRIYINSDGTVDYFLYKFSKDQITEEKEHEFERLLNIFLKDHKFPASAKEKFAQCSPVKYSD
jgi:Predicted Zn-dependent protease (DUF2268)